VEGRTSECDKLELLRGGKHPKLGGENEDGKTNARRCFLFHEGNGGRIRSPHSRGGEKQKNH